jgi:hypothetical protein
MCTLFLSAAGEVKAVILEFFVVVVVSSQDCFFYITLVTGAEPKIFLSTIFVKIKIEL